MEAFVLWLVSDTASIFLLVVGTFGIVATIVLGLGLFDTLRRHVDLC